ncbi:MAG: phage terminase large subunit [Candidatus Ornithomonoglobus sp.]
MMNIIQLGARLELARRSFFYYCNLKAPDFYKPDRRYLVNFCDELQEFQESEDEILIINMPPRHGKSRTASLFIEWVLGRNRQAKIMTGSYNEILSTSFSKTIRNDISEEKADSSKIVFSDVFPNVRIKRGDAAMKMWSLEGGYNNFLATSPSGTATGFGCSLMVIDDLIKNSAEAYNEDVLEKQWSWFTNTMLSRLEEGGKIIIIMTRWASGDLAGRALEHYGRQGARIKHICLKAVQDDGTMLCPEILSKKSYDAKVKAMGADIASANYQQEPIDLKGQLYTHFKTYSKLPTGITRILSYCDTADEGSDYLCNIIWGEYDKEAYILDVYYTKEPMEVTELETARRLVENRVNIADIESNNGGRSFARQLTTIMKSRYNSNHTVVRWFHQSENKTARILSNSTWVMEHVYYPENWRDRWPEYYEAMIKYQREGKNKNDDAPDATTGIAETMNKPRARVISKKEFYRG